MGEKVWAMRYQKVLTSFMSQNSYKSFSGVRLPDDYLIRIPHGAVLRR